MGQVSPFFDYDEWLKDMALVSIKYKPVFECVVHSQLYRNIWPKKGVYFRIKTNQNPMVFVYNVYIMKTNEENDLNIYWSDCL